MNPMVNELLKRAIRSDVSEMAAIISATIKTMEHSDLVMSHYTGNWQDTCPKWDEVVFINTMGFELYYQKYLTAVKWLHANVSNPKTNARWIMINDACYFKFRRKTDATMFALTFAG